MTEDRFKEISGMVKKASQSAELKIFTAIFGFTEEQAKEIGVPFEELNEWNEECHRRA